MSYEISGETMIILPINVCSSKVIEIENELIVQDDTFTIIKKGCEFFGSSYKGRHIGTKTLTGITHKSPIIMEETSKLIFFPTASPLNENCIWINLKYVKSYIKKNEWQSALIFSNGDELDLDISIGSLTNQVLRATRLQAVLEDRIKKMK